MRPFPELFSNHRVAPTGVSDPTVVLLTAGANNSAFFEHASITAPGRRLEQVDAHGNISHLLTIEEPHREISVVVRAIVEAADSEEPQESGMSAIRALAACARAAAASISRCG